MVWSAAENFRGTSGGGSSSLACTKEETSVLLHAWRIYHRKKSGSTNLLFLLSSFPESHIMRICILVSP